MPYDWSRTHAGQPEIERYINDSIDHFGVRQHMRFNSPVVSTTWDEARAAYPVHCADGTEGWFDVVVSRVGLLSNPRYPGWPGRDALRGHMFHTAHWDHSVDLSGRRVAFVGTGSTTAQVVSAIVAEVGHLYVFQREPGWVIPKDERDYRSSERAAFRHVPLRRRIERYRQYRVGGRLAHSLWKVGWVLNRETRDTSKAFIDRIHDEGTRAAVTPTYDYGCKRTIRASTFYAALNRDNVTLVPAAVERVTADGPFAAGREFGLDVIVLGTGFLTQDYLASLDVRARDGRCLHEVWAGDARAFVGATVPGLSNFFMLYGPNTKRWWFDHLSGRAGGRAGCSRGSAPAAGREVRRHPSAGTGSLPRVGRRQGQGRMSAQRQCHHYYFADSERNATQWPASHLTYHLATLLLPIVAIRTERQRGSVIAATAAERDEPENVSLIR
jgi:cation diffusion facilitator CzcD-associated flavoprotein CzcO